MSFPPPPNVAVCSLVDRTQAQAWAEERFGPLEGLSDDGVVIRWRAAVGFITFIRGVDGSAWNEVSVAQHRARYRSDAELARDLHRYSGALTFYDCAGDAMAGKVVLLQRGGEREVWDPSLDPSSTVRCPACEGRHGLAELLARAAWDASVDVVTAPCPAARGHVEFRLSDDCVEFGYVYAAGARHFAGMEQAVVPGLTVERERDGLSVGFPGATLGIPAAKR